MTESRATSWTVDVSGVTFQQQAPFSLIAGPCVMESPSLVDEVAAHLTEITKKLGIGFVFKSSFDKANRTSGASPRGPGIEKGLVILDDIKKRYGCPIITDVHSPEQCAVVKDVVDILQIPAFLCRQTDLIQAAAATGRVLHIKKGQFLAPWDMKGVLKKAEDAGATKILVCERGACFGYNTLVSDFRSLRTLESFGWPVVFDATHSVQQPGGLGNASGGQRQFVEPLARAALAVGVAGLFMETHPDPDKALSDGPNMVPLAEMEGLLESLKHIDSAAKGRQYQKFSVI